MERPFLYGISDSVAVKCPIERGERRRTNEASCLVEMQCVTRLLRRSREPWFCLRFDSLVETLAARGRDPRSSASCSRLPVGSDARSSANPGGYSVESTDGFDPGLVIEI